MAFVPTSYRDIAYSAWFDDWWDRQVWVDGGPIPEGLVLQANDTSFFSCPCCRGDQPSNIPPEVIHALSGDERMLQVNPTLWIILICETLVIWVLVKQVQKYVKDEDPLESPFEHVLGEHTSARPWYVTSTLSTTMGMLQSLTNYLWVVDRNGVSVWATFGGAGRVYMHIIMSHPLSGIFFGQPEKMSRFARAVFFVYHNLTKFGIAWAVSAAGNFANACVSGSGYAAPEIGVCDAGSSFCEFYIERVSIPPYIPGAPAGATGIVATIIVSTINRFVVGPIKPLLCSLSTLPDVRFRKWKQASLITLPILFLLVKFLLDRSIAGLVDMEIASSNNLQLGLRLYCYAIVYGWFVTEPLIDGIEYFAAWLFMEKWFPMDGIPAKVQEVDKPSLLSRMIRCLFGPPKDTQLNDHDGEAPRLEVHRGSINAAETEAGQVFLKGQEMSNANVTP